MTSRDQWNIGNSRRAGEHTADWKLPKIHESLISTKSIYWQTILTPNTDQSNVISCTPPDSFWVTLYASGEHDMQMQVLGRSAMSTSLTVVMLVLYGCLSVDVLRPTGQLAAPQKILSTFLQIFILYPVYRRWEAIIGTSGGNISSGSCLSRLHRVCGCVTGQ